MAHCPRCDQMHSDKPDVTCADPFWPALFRVPVNLDPGPPLGSYATIQQAERCRRGLRAAHGGECERVEDER